MDAMMDLRPELERLCPPEQYLMGVADLRGCLSDELSAFGYGLSIARRLDKAVLDGITKGPTRAYFNLYHAVNEELNGKTEAIHQLLTQRGILSRPVKATVYEEEMPAAFDQNLRYILSHKMVAVRAGMGWIGKTDLFVTERFGPRFRLASVLTAQPVFQPGAPITHSRCGGCSVCVDACPAHAATGELWDVTKDRDVFYDAHRCRAYCREITFKNLGEQISICGICMASCPKGR